MAGAGRQRKKIVEPQSRRYFIQLDSGIQWKAHEPQDNRNNRDIPELTPRTQGYERQEKGRHEPRGKSHRTRALPGRCQLHDSSSNPVSEAVKGRSSAEVQKRATARRAILEVYCMMYKKF